MSESYSIEGATLEITYDGGQGVLRYTSQHFPLENVLWTLVAMNGDDNLVGQPTTALFEPGTEPGQGGVGGAAMCNHYAGTYTQDQETLKIENILTSLMSCPENVMQAESTYLETLGAAQSYQIFGTTLVITSEKGILTYSADRTPLEGTYWRLNSMGTITSPTVPSQGGEFIAQFVPQDGWTGRIGDRLDRLQRLQRSLPGQPDRAQGRPAQLHEQYRLRTEFLGAGAAVLPGSECRLHLPHPGEHAADPL